MKLFTVIVTPEAQAGIRESFLFISRHSPTNAKKWIQGLYDRVDALERSPDRCAYARERDFLEIDEDC